MMRILPLVVGLLSTKSRTFLTISITLLGVVFPFGPDRSFELGVGVPFRLLLVQAIPQSFLADVEPLDGGLIVSEYLIEGAFRPLRVLRLHLLFRFGRRPVTFKNMILESDRACLLYTSPSPRDKRQSRMPSSA